MRRRDFIKVIVGSGAAWPLAARAQQGEHMRRIGVLMNFGADDREAPASVEAFSQGLAESGWIIGRDARIDYRWYQGNPEAARAYAAELLTLTPDLILASGTQGAITVKQLTRTVPIVFTRVGDAVGSGIVNSLARPGGQRYRLHELRIQFRRKMAGSPKGDRAAPDPGRCFSRRYQPYRDRPVRCYSGHGDHARGASDPGQR